ncbi:hypothetical protein [Spirosoma sordidisoli]|uniref:Uncharacterized protein n=1 Tax=Spirosoma sordidisoli TaxID=2502893 RepID=A0A4Q2UPQ0_9BACT|nr:hypothetical protein [Spirosoma sordidisoli]RYC69595.1 hypothetical protein EQG79_13410 [Spirosoma sordidisoli]
MTLSINISAFRGKKQYSEAEMILAAMSHYRDHLIDLMRQNRTNADYINELFEQQQQLGESIDNLHETALALLNQPADLFAVQHN